mmetsp:Transcript_54462/g.111385  ORF Transcript_54462/g.111385 Transcript_54462/m.111385 type:complete len:219 (-) Transcript_54462:867-1523(-)
MDFFSVSISSSSRSFVANSSFSFAISSLVNLFCSALLGDNFFVIRERKVFFDFFKTIPAVRWLFSPSFGFFRPLTSYSSPKNSFRFMPYSFISISINLAFLEYAKTCCVSSKSSSDGFILTIIAVRAADSLVKWPMNIWVSLLSRKGITLVPLAFFPSFFIALRHRMSVIRLLLIFVDSFCLELPTRVLFDRSLPAKSTIQTVFVVSFNRAVASSSVE